MGHTNRSNDVGKDVVLAALLSEGLGETNLAKLGSFSS